MAEFLLPIPRSVLLKMLEAESRDKGLSDHAVRVSLLLDVDAGRVPSQREAARLWGWSHKKVRINWLKIWSDVYAWSTWNGSNIDNKLVQKIPEHILKLVTNRVTIDAKTPENRGALRGAVRGAFGAQSGAQKSPLSDNTGTNGAQSGAHLGRSQGRSEGAHTIQKTKDKRKSIKSTTYSRAKSDRVDLFDSFWIAYDKKVDRKKCAAKWARLPEEEIPLIMKHVQDYVRQTPEVRYRKNPLTYLNGECWRDGDGENHNEQEPIISPEPDAGRRARNGKALEPYGESSGPANGSSGSSRVNGRIPSGHPFQYDRRTGSERRSQYGADDAARDVANALRTLRAGGGSA